MPELLWWSSTRGCESSTEWFCAQGLLLICQSGNQSPARPAVEITSILETFPLCSAQNSKSSLWKWKINTHLIPRLLDQSCAPPGTAQGTGSNSSSFLGSWHTDGAVGGISSLDHHFALCAVTTIWEATRGPKLRQQTWTGSLGLGLDSGKMSTECAVWGF